MRSKIRNKKVLAVIAVVAALAIAGGALAYYLGSGSGNGTVAHGAQDNLAFTVTVGDGSNGPALYPGDQTGFTGQVANSTGHEARLNGIALDSTYGTNGISISGAAGTCLPSWFSVSGLALSPDTSGITLPDGGGEGVVGTLHFADPNVDQSGCSGALINVGLVTN